MDVDAASIASQLRDYDARRDSEVVDDLVRLCLLFSLGPSSFAHAI